MKFVARRLALAGLLLLHVAGSAAADDEALRAWIRNRFPQVRRTTLEQCLAQAGREGLLATPADLAALKRTFRAEQRAALPARGASGCPAPTSTSGQDLETNDSPAWADDLGSGSGSATGAISPVGDRDVFRLTLPSDSTVFLGTGPAGLSPILDTTLTLEDQDGQWITFNDNPAVGLHAAIRMDLPAGVYFARVEGYGAASGGYQLIVNMTPVTMLQLQPGVPVHVNVPGPGQEAVVRMSLSADSQVQLLCSGSTPTFDPYLTLLRARGGRILGVDNSGTAGSSDPGLQATLPAGEYLVAVGALQGNGVVQVRLQVAAAPVSTLPCGVPRTGAIAGEEWRDVYRLPSPAGTRLMVTTAPAGTTPVPDTVLEIFDQDFALVTRSDDDLAGLYGALDVPLPAGTYYAVVRGGFNATGGYAVTARCYMALLPGQLENGRNVAAVTVPGRTAAFGYRVATACPLQLLTDNTLGTIPFPILALLDASGHVLASDVWGSGPRGAAFGGALLAPGEYTVLVRDELGTPGQCDLLAVPMLYTEPRTPAAILNSMDKAGRVLILLCSPSVGPGIPLPAGPLSGVFLLQPAPLFVIATASVPATGFHPWPFVLPPSPPPLQAVSIDFLTLTGRLTNLEQ